MKTTRRGQALSMFLAVAASVPLVLTASRPAAAFRTGQSPDFTHCTIWFNDEGKPLRSKAGREIAEQVPCPGQSAHHDTYTATAGGARNTLVVRDHSHHIECVLGLAAGSRVVMVPTSCKAMNP